MSSWTRAVAVFDSGAFLTLVILSLVVAAAITVFPDQVPPVLILLPMTLGSIVVGPRQLPWLVALGLVLVLGGVAQQVEFTVRYVIQVALIFVVGAIYLLFSVRRGPLGIAGSRGESLLVELRDRIMRVSNLPPLPRDWYAEVVLRSAGGTPFAGDFVVAARPGAGTRLEIAVVDVSGHGEQAGARALQLSGAFGGLLAAVPSEDFLGAANDYLVRQDWDEGFATAVHLSVDLDTGDMQLRCAGHPPAVHWNAGTGRWSAVYAEGPALGLIPDTIYEPMLRTVRPGDAVMLYTDGLVETPTRDLSMGIDRLLGQSERELRTGFDSGGIERLIESLGSRNDDRALLVVHRRWSHAP